MDARIIIIIRFLLPRLFLSVTLFAISAALVVSRIPEANENITVAKFWIAVALFGSAIGSLYKRPIIGMVIGATTALAIVGIIAWILFTYCIE